ncbi:hypothetical protein GCM10010447_03570 [Streptomyces fulvorobeus]
MDAATLEGGRRAGDLCGARPGSGFGTGRYRTTICEDIARGNLTAIRVAWLNAGGGPMGAAELATSVRVSIRCGDEAAAEDLEWSTAPLRLLRTARPWRTFR